jgi:hypothetical protein
LTTRFDRRESQGTRKVNVGLCCFALATRHCLVARRPEEFPPLPARFMSNDRCSATDIDRGSLLFGCRPAEGVPFAWPAAIDLPTVAIFSCAPYGERTAPFALAEARPLAVRARYYLAL